MRRLKDLLAGHISDLGGSDHCSHSERILASKASMICLLTEMQEQQFARAKFNVSPRQLACYLHACGNLTRILQTLGLQRRARTIGPTFGDLLRADLVERESEVASDVSDE